MGFYYAMEVKGCGTSWGFECRRVDVGLQPEVLQSGKHPLSPSGEVLQIQFLC